jgi:hypothetical protein
VPQDVEQGSILLVEVGPSLGSPRMNESVVADQLSRQTESAGRNLTSSWHLSGKAQELAAAMPGRNSVYRRDAKLRIAAGFGLLFPKACIAIPIADTFADPLHGSRKEGFLLVSGERVLVHSPRS